MADLSRYRFIIASEADHYLAAATLFREYAAFLDVDLCFQNFDQELIELDKQYGEPSGGLILVQCEEKFIGCAAVRKFSSEIGELKRMFIQPAHRGDGLGQELLQRAVDRGLSV